jgi:hypothetical protein
VEQLTVIKKWAAPGMNRYELRYGKKGTGRLVASAEFPVANADAENNAIEAMRTAAHKKGLPFTFDIASYAPLVGR